MSTNPLCDLRDLCAMLSPDSGVLAADADMPTNPLCDLCDLCAMLSPIPVFSPLTPTCPPTPLCDPPSPLSPKIYTRKCRNGWIFDHMYLDENAEDAAKKETRPFDPSLVDEEGTHPKQASQDV